jgi:type IV secretory pathway TrbF-like protein
MVLNIFCLSAAFYETLQVKYKVFWATEDMATHSLVLHKIDPVSNVSDAIIVSQLQEFIVEVKTVLSDGFLMKKWNKKQASLCSDAAYNQLKNYWQLHNQFEIAMSQSIEVEVNSVMKIPATKDSWEIHWTEIHLEKSQGQEVLREHWSAILQVGTREIKKDEDLLNNPSGINIESFTWQKVL